MNYSNKQLFALVVLRIFIGWHFLYEGLLKLFNTGWTSRAYLLSSDGPFESFFTWLGSESVIGTIDVLTIAILLVVGISLIVGFNDKFGSFMGMGMLLMFYLAHPAFPGLQTGPAEGNYFIVNKNLIELMALAVVAYFPTSDRVGIDMFLKKSK